MACWPSVALLHNHVCICSGYHCSWAWEADSCPVVCHFGACAGHVSTLCLHYTRSFGSVAWRDILHCSSVAFLLPPLPPSAFLVEGLPLLPRFFPVFVFFPCFGGLFILCPLGFWPQCDGCYSGGLGLITGSLLASWCFFFYFAQSLPY